MAGKERQGSSASSSSNASGPGLAQNVLEAWSGRLTVPWGPLLTQEEAERGLSYWGSGERLKRVAAALLAGKPIKVKCVEM